MESIGMKLQITQLVKMIRECNGTDSNITHISKYCLTKSAKNEVTEVEIAKTFENFITEAYMMETKLNILRIMTEILIENTSKTYFRHLSSRIIMLINNCRQDFITQTDNATILTIKGIFAKWKETKVFSDVFYNKILNTAGPALIFKIENELQPIEFKKYSKKFLMEARDVGKIEIASLFYKQHQQLEKYSQELGKLSSREISLSIQPNEQTKQEQAKELLQATDALIKDHILTLTNFYSGMQLVFAFYKEEEKSLGVIISPSKDEDD